MDPIKLRVASFRGGMAAVAVCVLAISLLMGCSTNASSAQELSSPQKPDPSASSGLGLPLADFIRSIDEPHIIPASMAAEDGLTDREQVIGVTQNGESRAYPITILFAHEIVNDVVGGHPIAVTF